MASGVGGRIAGADELNPLQSHPAVVGGSIEAILKPMKKELSKRRNSNHFNELANETDHSLRAVFVWSGQIDFVAENDQPSGELHGGEHNTVWSASVRSW